MALCSLGNQAHLAPAFNAIPLLPLMLFHGLPMYLHSVPELLLSDVHLAAGGATLRWIADQLAPLEKRQAARRGSSIYEELLAEMPEQPTALLVLPDLGAATTRRRGALLGLTLSTTRGEITRAFLEGIAYHLAEGAEHLQQVGVRLNVLRAAAGGARSERWLQLLADVLGLDVERPEQIETVPLGAALLAGVGSGAYAHADEAARAAVRVGARFAPQARNAAFYQEQRQRYRELAAILPD
jgi:xylulokinase